MRSPYRDLRTLSATRPDWSWLLPLLDESDRVVSCGNHGDLPRWNGALAGLPEAKHFFDGNRDAPELGLVTGDPDGLTAQLMEFHPWRKGPLMIGGVPIETEWRSDWKWKRIADHLELQGHRILDIGCGNGYYGWRMLGQGAESVIGIDPTIVFVMQWLACRHFAGAVPNFVLPMGVDSLPADSGGFDSVFSMGVLYHRRDPVAHLERLRTLVRPGGQIILETLVLDGEEDRELNPGERYARMRNVWSVPSIARLASWVSDAGLKIVRMLDVSRTMPEEQRSTNWMKFESLRECLDPDDQLLTVEGHPAPVRAALLVKWQ